MSIKGIAKTILITELTIAVIEYGELTDFKLDKFGPRLREWIDKVADCLINGDMKYEEKKN